MKTIVRFINEYAIVQGLITLALVGTTCYLYIVGQAVPESLLGFDGLALGFYLSGQAHQAGSKS